jgi:hypothetical protein
MASDIEEGKSVVWGSIKKEGMMGLVLVAMMYFIWQSNRDNRADQSAMKPVLEKNTEAISKNSVVQEQTQKVMGIAIEAGQKNNNVVEKATAVLERVERRTR